MIVDRVCNGYKLWILGDLNGWIGDRVRASITGAFRIPGENDNSRRGMEFCAEMGLCGSNTYFEHRSLLNYTKTARVQDRVEVKSMIELVLVKKDLLSYVQDVRAVRGIGRSLSDYHVVLCKVRLLGAWIMRKDVAYGARRIRSVKLRYGV